MSSSSVDGDFICLDYTGHYGTLFPFDIQHLSEKLSG